MLSRAYILAIVLSVAAAGAAAQHAYGQGCQFRWSSLGSELERNTYPFYFYVNALAVFDDGTGSAVYSGGTFDVAGGVPANGIAKWDGNAWSPLGSGVDFYVTSLAVFDDGYGPALYAGGNFSQAGGAPAEHIAKWDGNTWSALGAGLGSDACPWCFYVNSLAVFDDGTGPALYAGGSFTQAGGQGANYIAKWDGSTWSALGSGVDQSPVVAMTAFDDGTGPALYAAGSFDQAGGVPNSHTIARWDGSAWSAVGGGLGEFDVISDLLVFDEGSGPALYAAGTFDYPNRFALARWDGYVWSFFGAGPGHQASALAAFDDGTGPAVYVGGHLSTEGGDQVIGVARWDGYSLTLVGAAAGPYVLDVAGFDDGTGPTLYAAGQFSGIEGVTADSLAKWSCRGGGGDLDGDGDVDLDDFGAFAACYNGATNPPAPGCPEGVDADLDGDGDVDLDDFSIFAANYTGSL